MKYELMLILDPKQTDKEIEKILKEVKWYFRRKRLQLIGWRSLGQASSAYKIKGQTHGYAVMLFQGGACRYGLSGKEDLRIQSGIARQNDHQNGRWPPSSSFWYDSLPSLNKHAEELSKKYAQQNVKLL